MSTAGERIGTKNATTPGSGGYLRVEGISKQFGGLAVFHDVSFALSPGQVIGVIGPNGAGKTTLINVVSGMLAPSGGKILLDDRDMTGLPCHILSRNGVVRSFQQANSFRSETVRENLLRAIYFSGGDGRIWDEIEDLLAEFQLAQALEERSDKLPYGTQKMLGLMMAYVTRPKIMLLDEPAAGLERGERIRVDRLVQAAVDRIGAAVLIVEHDMDLVRRLCPTSIVLNAGSVLAVGPTAEVLSRADVIDAYVGASDD